MQTKVKTNTVKLTAPTRRRRVRADREAPFPIPIATVTGEPAALDHWNYYTGELVGCSIIVQHSGDMEFLYKMGYFGKGNLSRHQPSYTKSFFPPKRSREEREPVKTLRVFSRRKYLVHLGWQKQASGSVDEYNALMDSEYNIFPASKPPPSKFAHESNEPFPTVAEVGQHIQTELAPSQEGPLDTLERGSKVATIQSNTPLQTEYIWTDAKDDWPSVEETREVDPWATDDPNMSEDFWGTSKSNESLKAKTVVSQIDKGSECEGDAKAVTPTLPAVPACHRDHPEDPANTSTSIHAPNRQGRSGSVSPRESLPEDMESTPTDDVDEKTTRFDDVSTVGDDVTKQGPSVEAFHPACLSQDDHGNLYVVDDSDDGDDSERGKSLEWIPTQKYDPWTLTECLQLTPEEAFFLSYALGCLIVLDEKKEPMGLVEMWQTFCKRRKNFVQNYVVYHSLRSRGWVPKPGLKYGAEYVVYHQGPPFYHASYCVKVLMIPQGGAQQKPEPHRPAMTWRSVMGTGRVTEQVAKEVLVCYVIRPRDLTDQEMLSPKCLPRFKLQEVLVKRWISSKGREEGETHEWM